MSGNNNSTPKWVAIIISILIFLMGGAVFANRARIEKHDDILMELKSDTTRIETKLDILLERTK